jgi:TRAP-type C4-dicarboxylate transport system substrate-binding protein
MKANYRNELGTSIIMFVLLSILLTPVYSQAAGQKVIELKFASISSPTHILNTKVNQPWIKRIESATNGRVKITLFPSQALGSSRQAYDLAVKGIADISYGWLHYYPGRFPLTEVYMLPSICPNLNSANHVWEVYQKHLKKEWAETKVLWLCVGPGTVIMTSKKQIRTVEDLKGVKLALGGTIPTKAMKALGAVPVEVSQQDMYTAIQRGVVDGNLGPMTSAVGNKAGEVLNYYAKNMKFCSIPFFCVMNLDTWKSLPADIQRIIDENTGKKMSITGNTAYWGYEETAAQKLVEQSRGKGVAYDISAKEMKRMQDLIHPLWDEWTRNVEAKGLPGKKVVETVKGFREEK